MILTTNYAAHWARLNNYRNRVMVDLTEDEYNECIAVVNDYGSSVPDCTAWDEDDGIIFTVMKCWLDRN